MAQLLADSCLYQIWIALCSLYRQSAVHAFLCELGLRLEKKGRESRLLDVLCREGVVAKAWESSRTCRFLTAAVNLPATLLHRLYLAGKRLFDGSFFCGLAFALGDETAIGQSWLIMLLWCIPFSRWNNAYHFIGFAVLLVLFYLRGMRDGVSQIQVERIGFYPALLFLGICLAYPLSSSPSLSARFLGYHIAAALCVVLTVSAVRNAGDLKRLAAGGGFAVLISASYGVYQRIQGVQVNPSYVDAVSNPNMPGRVESFFDNPNTFAEVLILLLPLLAALIFASKHRISRLAAAAGFAVGIAALGMTYSRASWIGLACSAVVFIFLWKPSLIPLFFFLCLACVPLMPGTIMTRIASITDLSDTTTSSRFPLYKAALETIRSSPVSGAGLGTKAVQQYIETHNLYHGIAPYVHAHDIYLEVWVEAGLLGIVGLIGSMLWNVKNTARAVRHCRDSAARTITAACSASMCGIMVAGLADDPWNYPRVMVIFWFVFALGIAGIRMCRREQA